MNVVGFSCLNCGSRTLKISIQTFEKRTPIGYYCINCEKFYDLTYTPLISASVIISLTPGLEEYKKEDAYRAIFKALKNPEKHLVKIPDKKEDDPISAARDQIGSALHKFCRDPGDHEPARLNHESFKKDLQKEFQNIFKKHPLKNS